MFINLLIPLIMATTDTAATPRFTPQDLPYAYDALAPAISEETMHYHHDKHYAGYVDKLNELIVDTPFAGQPLEDIILSADGPVYNNAAQAWNHEFFFEQLSPKPQKEPSGELLEAINRDFGSFDELKVQIGRAAAAFRLGVGVACRGPLGAAGRRQRTECRQSHAPRHETAAGVRRVGARLLHRLPEPPRRCRRGLLGRRRLEGRGRPLRQKIGGSLRCSDAVSHTGERHFFVGGRFFSVTE